MKEYLIGVGGVGGFYGGLLAESGADMTLVARGESFRAIKESGLDLNLPDGIHHLKPQIIEHLSGITNPDLIILAVKSYDLAEVARELVGLVQPETTILTIQNGLDNDLVVAKYLDCEVLPGLVLVATTKMGPNNVIQRGPQKKLIFGPRDGQITAKMKAIASELLRAGIEARVVENIAEELWKKYLFVLAFASATAVGRCAIGDALSTPEAREVYEKVLREAIEVGRAEGIALAPDIFETTLAGALAFDPGTKSSLLVDLENHRQTEVEALQGVILRLAEKHQVSVPATRKVYDQIRNVVK